MHGIFTLQKCLILQHGVRQERQLKTKNETLAKFLKGDPEYEYLTRQNLVI